MIFITELSGVCVMGIGLILGLLVIILGPEQLLFPPKFYTPLLLASMGMSLVWISITADILIDLI